MSSRSFVPSRRPVCIVPVALAVAAGIATAHTGATGDAPLGVTTLAVGMLAVLVSSLWILRTPASCALALAMAAAFVLGAVHTRSELHRLDGSLARLALEGRRVVTLRMTLLETPFAPARPSPPDPGGGAPATSRTFDLPPSVSVRARVDAALAPSGRWHPLDGEVILRAPAWPRGLLSGDPIVASGALKAPPSQRNDGGYDARSAALVRGIVGELRIADPANVRSDPSSGVATASWRRSVERLRCCCWQKIVTHFDERDAGWLGSLLLGIRAALPQADRETLRRTGTLHFFAISGLHVVLLGTMLESLLKPVPLGRRARLAVFLGSLATYATLTGLSVSVVRASIMLGAARIGSWLDRSRTPLDALAIAALAIWFVEPLALFQPGFQLSFVAVASILVASSEPWSGSSSVRSGAGARVDPGLAARLVRFIRRVLVSCAQTVRTTLIVLLGTLPWMLCYFHGLHPAAIPGAPLLLPLVVAALAGGFVWLGLALASSSIASAATWPVALALDGMRGILDRLDTGWLATRELPPASAPMIALYLASGISLAYRLRRLGLTLVAAALAIYAFGLRERPPRMPVIEWLDVGHGTSTLLRFPDGRSVLYDAGSMMNEGVGARVIVPALHAARVRTLDLLVLSHADRDHTNGARDVIDAIRVARLVIPHGFEDSPGGDAIVRHARREGVAVSRASAGVVLLDTPPSPRQERYRITVLHPNPHARIRLESDNDRSLVLRIEIGRRTALLTGDLEEAGIAALLETADPACDILVLPHHGSEAANLDRLLELAAPTVVIASGRERSLDARRAAWLRDRAIRCFATWQHGRIRIRLAPEDPESRLAPGPRFGIETFVAGLPTDEQWKSRRGSVTVSPPNEGRAPRLPTSRTGAARARSADSPPDEETAMRATSRPAPIIDPMLETARRPRRFTRAFGHPLPRLIERWAILLLVVGLAGTMSASSSYATPRTPEPVVTASAPQLSGPMRRELEELGEQFWKSRPKTRFESWDAAERAAVRKAAEAIQFDLEDGQLDDVVEALWKPSKKFGPRARMSRGKAIIDTPYGEAWFYVAGGGRDKGLIVGLHGGGEGAGSADEPRGTWRAKDCIGAYPQGIRLVHDTWNTVHGERFILTILEIAKVQLQVDPDRVYVAGFSMGGTGSWFMAGRHPDLLAASLPFSGVLMAEPKSQLEHKEEVVAIQHGLLPNVRNLPMHYTIGLEDKNTMPGTYLFVWDRIEELREKDPGGYENIYFESFPKLAHGFPPGEPKKALQFLGNQVRERFPETIVWEHATQPFPLRTDEDQTTRIGKPAMYWIGCPDPVDRQTIRATRSGNTIEIETTMRPSHKGLTIYLNPEMIDTTSDVKVIYGGKEVYSGQPEPDLWTILETLDFNADRRLVFDRRIDL